MDNYAKQLFEDCKNHIEAMLVELYGESEIGHVGMTFRTDGSFHIDVFSKEDKDGHYFVDSISADGWHEAPEAQERRAYVLGNSNI